MKELEVFLYKLYELKLKYENEYDNTSSYSYIHTIVFRDENTSMFLKGKYSMLNEIISMLEDKNVEKPPFIKFTLKERLKIFLKGKL